MHWVRGSDIETGAERGGGPDSRTLVSSFVRILMTHLEKRLLELARRMIGDNVQEIVAREHGLVIDVTLVLLSGCA